MSSRLHQFGVHGVQSHRDWAAIEQDEARAVLARYSSASQSIKAIRWHSARPFSAAALVSCRARQPLFIKRHHMFLRNVEALEEEHRFMEALHHSGIQVTLPLRCKDGSRAVAFSPWTYEVFPAFSGTDLYRDRMSWTPFLKDAHAAAAGKALGALHRASEHFDAPARIRRPLVSGMTALCNPDLVKGLEDWLEQQPFQAVNRYAPGWRQKLRDAFDPLHRRLLPHLDAIRPLWGHGDWHGSNLLWSDQRESAYVIAPFDFGMADRTCAPFDLAVAIERNTIGWMEAPESRPVAMTQIEAMVRSYLAEHPLSGEERAQVVAFLPLVHVEFALSELGYFLDLVHDETAASAAFDGYLLGHAAWFRSRAGTELLTRLNHILGLAEGRHVTH